MNFIKKIINALSLIRTSSQLEYHIRCKQPQTHAELERLVRDYYSLRGL
jgi:CDP-diacylglycerol pyrophosphatase